MNEGFDQVLLSAIMSTAVDAIIVIDASGIMRDVNPATTRLFGYQADELIGNNVSMLMPNPFRKEHDQYLQNYIETRKPKIIGIGREVVALRKDGSTFPIHLAVSELPAREDRLFAGIVRDISDLKQIQQQLLQVNQQLEERVQERTEELQRAQSELITSARLAMLGQIAGGIAHEIRNPLNAIRTSAYYLRNAPNLTTQKSTEHMERIDRQVVVIEKVITALTDVVKLDEAQSEVCDIARVVEEVVGGADCPATIRVVNRVAKDLPAVKIDQNQIAIVISNLLRNSIQAMPEGGVIELHSLVDEKTVAIKVHDTGCGIAQDDLRRITEPLFSTKSRGMGLGLAISAVILDKNNSRMEVCSQLNVGTCVDVYLPRADIANS